MAHDPAIAVIDIGKSNAKLALVDSATRATIAIRTMPNAVLTDGPYPHYDIERIWHWIVEGLGVFGRQAPVETISVTTHGACLALVGGEGLTLPIMDYEYSGLEVVRADYRLVRGDFGETLSPDLPNGLNAGRQLYWQRRKFPEAFARTRAILPYPQYWAWRLTGAMATEATSLGCHTDLWNPRTGTFSAFARSEGLAPLFPRLVKAWDTAGTLLPAVAAAAGLPPGTRVVAGVHDSNASLLPHLLARPRPFAVLSTGTWMVAFAVGGGLDRLDANRDCLANVDAFGHPVPSARFMAGREYEILCGGAEATDDAAARIVAAGVMALPCFAPGTGPFGGAAGRWTADPSRLSGEERAAAAGLYVALVTEVCLALAGAEGPIIVEGPFARNRIFLGALAQLVRRPVIARPDATGTIDGAAMLAAGPETPPALHDPQPAGSLPFSLAAYADAWRTAVAARR